METVSFSNEKDLMMILKDMEGISLKLRYFLIEISPYSLLSYPKSRKSVLYN